MSMRKYAIESYGLVLTKTEFQNFGRKYMQINEPKIYEEENWAEDDVYECADRIDIVCQIGNFTGESMRILESGTDDWADSVLYDGDTIFVLELNHFPSLFNKAYDSYEDLIIRLKESYQQYLPDDFDYASHLCHVVGTVWC